MLIRPEFEDDSICLGFVALSSRPKTYYVVVILFSNQLFPRVIILNMVMESMVLLYLENVINSSSASFSVQGLGGLSLQFLAGIGMCTLINYESVGLNTDLTWRVLSGNN